MYMLVSGGDGFLLISHLPCNFLTWDRASPQLLFMGSWSNRINTKCDGPGLWAPKARLLVQAYNAKFRVPTNLTTNKFAVD